MSPGLLHRLWRTLPAGPRRRALLAGASLLAPRPDQVPPPCAAGAAVAGELGRASGLGEGARLMLAGLDALGLPSWPVGKGMGDGMGQGAFPPAAVPLIVHANAAVLPLAMLRLGRAMVRGRRVVGMWPWELTTVPESWKAGFAHVHEVWAPSRFAADAVERAMPADWPGRHRVRVVPHPVACRPPNPAPLDRAALGLPRDAVITLFVGSLASSFARKNPLGAIEAHRRAFGADPGHVLLLRIGDPAGFPEDFRTLQAAALPNVILDTGTRSRDEAHAAMAASDIVLSLHRSEGFGLVPAEAMLLGKPVVLTAWSGTEDFCTDDCTVRIPVDLVPAIDPRGVFQAPGAVWADPDLDAAAAALRRLAGNEAERRRLGAAARAAAAVRLGPAALAEALAGLA